MNGHRALLFLKGLLSGCRRHPAREFSGRKKAQRFDGPLA
jgi:hypothetical protein